MRQLKIIDDWKNIFEYWLERFILDDWWSNQILMMAFCLKLAQHWKDVIQDPRLLNLIVDYQWSITLFMMIIWLATPIPPLYMGLLMIIWLRRTKDWNRNFQQNSQRRRSAIWSHDLQRSQWSPWSEIQYAESNDTTHDTTTTYMYRDNGLMTHSRFCFVLKPMERGSWRITASVASKKNSHFALKVRKSRHSEMNQVEKLG